MVTMTNPHPIVVGIAGGSGSGKTTVADRIVARLGTARATLIQHDSYYLDRRELSPENRARLNFDHPDALETQLLVEQLKQLVAGKAVEIPVYDFANHERKSETHRVEPHSVILLEGILVMADQTLRDMLDIKVFVDTEADLRLIRRIERDIATRKRTLHSVVQQYLDTVRPMHLRYVEPCKRYADVLIPEGGFNNVAMNSLFRKIESALQNPEPETPIH